MDCLDPNVLADFADGGAIVERAEIEQHLDACSHCRELLAAAVRASGTSGARRTSAQITVVERPAATQVRELATRFERGAKIGRYRVLEPIGMGGMGVVFAAYDGELDRDVAVKVLRRDVLVGVGDAEARARLLREGQALARLSHPNIVSIYDVGTDRDHVFLAMELVRGQTLTEWLRTTRRTEEIVAVFCAAGDGLSAAHDAGIVHRDFKPENVLVAERRVVVTDFGLARAAGEAVPASNRAPATPLESLLTRTGTVMGTPAYMAPEQQRGESSDAASDQYSFCVALYEALHGARPGDAGAPGRSAPRRLDRICARGLAPRSADRYSSMAAVVAELRRDPARRVRRIALVTAATAAVAAGALVVERMASPVGDSCGGAASRVAAVWTERKAAVRAALEATGSPLAADAWRGIEATLDARAARWAELARGECEATRVRREQAEDIFDRKMVCLDQQLVELDALVRLLAHADVAIVERAVVAADAAARPESCEEPSVVLGRPAPRRDVAAEAIRHSLADAKALLDAGKYADAGDAASRARQQARALGDSQLLGETALALGEARWAGGDLPAAQTEFHAATQAAEASRDDFVAARAQIALFSVAAVGREPPAEVDRRSDYATAAIARIGGSHALEAELALARGQDFTERGRYAEALTELATALALTEKTHPEPDTNTAQVIGQIGAAQFQLGKLDDARRSYERAEKILEATVGPSHPLVGATSDALGSVYTQLGRTDDAARAYARAREIAARAVAADHPAQAFALSRRAEELAGQERYAEALQLYRQALAIVEAKLGRDHPGVGYALTGVGRMQFRLGRFDDAIVSLARALAVREAHETDLGMRGETRYLLARALWEANRDRGRAHDLAVQARAELAGAGELAKPLLAKVDVWLDAHPPPR